MAVAREAWPNALISYVSELSNSYCFNMSENYACDPLGKKGT